MEPKQIHPVSLGNPGNAKNPVKNNEHTKAQIKNWFEMAIRQAQNPNPREKMKRKRDERRKIVQNKFGL